MNNTKHPNGVYTHEQIEAGLDRLLDDIAGHDMVHPLCRCQATAYLGPQPKPEQANAAGASVEREP